jgi:hypothetical protein
MVKFDESLITFGEHYVIGLLFLFVIYVKREGFLLLSAIVSCVVGCHMSAVNLK